MFIFTDTVAITFWKGFGILKDDITATRFDET